jgi:hypothetical protein
VEQRFKRLFALAAGLPDRLVTESLSLQDERIDPESGVEDLVAEIAEVYGARLSVGEVVAMRTVGELWAAVQRRSGGRGRAEPGAAADGGA